MSMMGAIHLIHLRAIQTETEISKTDPPCAVVEALVAEICEIFGKGSKECDEALAICRSLGCNCGGAP